MAVYESKITDAKDYEQVSDYLFDLNERIKYYFMALTPEDNFTFEALTDFNAKGEKVGILEETKDGIQAVIANWEQQTSAQIQIFFNRIGLLVNTGQVTAQLNLESDNIYIQGDRLKISGENLSLTLAGDLVFRGEVIADLGDIGGWFIAGGEDQKYIGGTSNSKITTDKLDSDYEMDFNEVLVHGDTDLSNSEISISGTVIETDKSTILEDGVEAYEIDCHTYEVVAGTTRAYEEINANGQISCATCYTSADGSTWSDRRLKKDIEDLTYEEAAGILSYAQSFTYDRKDTGHHEAGFMAQDLRLCEEELDRKYGLTSERNGLYTVSYKALIPMLVKELQRQEAELDELSK